MGFEQLTAERPTKAKGAPRLPPLQGKRVAMHEAIEFEINVDDPPPTAPRRPLPYAAKPSVPPPAMASDAPPRATLSVTDYKRRMGIL